MISILISLVVLALFLTILFWILQKILPMIGVDADWTRIILAIIGLAALIWMFAALGYLPGWVRG